MTGWLASYVCYTPGIAIEHLLYTYSEDIVYMVVHSGAVIGCDT